MAEVKHVAVEAGEDGVRLDRFLRRRWPNLTQIQVFKLARGGQIRVDGGRAKADTRLRAGTIVRVPPLPEAPPSGRLALDAREIAFVKSLVLWEDDEIIILNKPAGLAVQGGTKTMRHLDRLLGAWGEGERRPRLVHRLDRDTSGALALGKTPAAAAFLARAFAERAPRKTYWAIVAGVPEAARGTIDIALIKTGAEDRERMNPAAGDPRGQTAITDYVVLAAIDRRAAWLALRPVTGRTHQLRVHLLSIGNPILGDPKYNTADSRALSGSLKLQLHARRLSLPRPGGGVLDVSAPISPEMALGFARFGLVESDLAADPFE